MEIIKKHKKVFIIIVIVSAVITGIVGASLIAFGASSSVTLTVTNEEKSEEIIPEPRKIQQNIPYNELDFSNGPVVFNKTIENKDGDTTGGGDIITAYLHKGDTLEFSYNAKIKKGEIGYSLLSKYGDQYMGTITGSHSSEDTIFIEEDGNYVFDYSMNNFRGVVEMSITVTSEK